MDPVNLTNRLTGQLTPVQGRSGNRKTDAGRQPDNSFGEMVKQYLNDVDSSQRSADKYIADLATGSNPDIHRTMIAVEKADISFQLMLQVRNKLVSAYQEISRMQV